MGSIPDKIIPETFWEIVKMIGLLIEAAEAKVP